MNLLLKKNEREAIIVSFRGNLTLKKTSAKAELEQLTSDRGLRWDQHSAYQFQN